MKKVMICFEAQNEDEMTNALICYLTELGARVKQIDISDLQQKNERKVFELQIPNFMKG